MNTNRSADLIRQIADATSFKTMKSGKSPVCLPNMSEAIFRKGKFSRIWCKPCNNNVYFDFGYFTMQ